MKKIDRTAAKAILDYMDDRISSARTPRDFGKSLRHDKHGLWRYRVGDYRVICEIADQQSKVIVLAIGHRSTIYD